MKTKINISVEKPDLSVSGLRPVIRRAFRATLKAEHVSEKCEINVMITDDEGIRKINLEQRKIDRATDVLSFPMQDLIPGNFTSDSAEYNPENGRLLLGDMVVSIDRIRSQAAEYGHSVNHELAYLTVHSCLHLLGYDHIDEGIQKQKMRAREKEIMQELRY